MKLQNLYLDCAALCFIVNPLSTYNIFVCLRIFSILTKFQAF